MLTCHKTTAAEKRLICAWKYEGDYAIYNTPSYEEQLKTGRGFANPRNNFYSFCQGPALIGYINLIEEAEEVFFGIGVDPTRCGQGYGQQITGLARQLSHRLYPGKPLYLEVRAWNARAVRCYEKAGFRIVGQPVQRTTPLGQGAFYHMVAE